MASTQPAPRKEAPLAMMAKLSQDVYLYTPPSGTPPPPPSTKGPRYIVLTCWFEAKEAHAAKYINQHIAIYPFASVLLLMCPMAHMVPNRPAQIQPAVDALAAFVDTLPADAPPEHLLFHSFSNGGGFNLARLVALWEKQTGGPLPPHVTILDSAPDRFTWSRSMTTLTSGVPAWARPFAKVVAVLVTVFLLSLGNTTVPTVGFRGLGSTAMLAKEVRRTYIYSKEDKMVDWRDVEDHAAEAEAKGAKLASGGEALIVRKELFVGSGHVSHSRLDADRYWRIVRETVEGRPIPE